jgi:hypothetical protein
MRKKAFLALAALAVLCCSAPAYAAQAECEDWLGTWEFTYDNATTTNICFDNASLFNGEFVACDNDSADNCTCLDNVTASQICIEDVDPYAQCDPDNYSGSGNCVCVANPYYKVPGPNGKQEVIITQATDNFTFLGNTTPCAASGKRGETDITIVQADNATAVKLGIDNSTYIVFEGAFNEDNITFAQILPANFTIADNGTTQFTAETLFNSIGLVSGIKGPVVPPVECDLTVIPGNFSLIRTLILSPLQIFVIRADRTSDTEFARPISIDWGTEAINDIVRLRLGKKIIFGVIFVRPFQLVAGDYTVTVTYGDPSAEACGEITVK